jgi:hypothetical protein
MVTAMLALQNYLLTVAPKKSKATLKFNGNGANVIFAYKIQRSQQRLWFLLKREDLFLSFSF